MHAAAQGLLDKQDAGKLLESSGKEMPEFYKRGHDYIATAGQVEPGSKPDPANRETLANMQNDWFNDVKQHPEWAQDPAKAEADFRGIVSRYQLVKADQNLLTLPVPKYMQGTRIQPDIQATKQATVKALENPGRSTRTNSTSRHSCCSSGSTPLKSRKPARRRQPKRRRRRSNGRPRHSRRSRSRLELVAYRSNYNKQSAGAALLREMKGGPKPAEGGADHPRLAPRRLVRLKRHQTQGIAGRVGDAALAVGKDVGKGVFVESARGVYTGARNAVQNTYDRIDDLARSWTTKKLEIENVGVPIPGVEPETHVSDAVKQWMDEMEIGDPQSVTGEFDPGSRAVRHRLSPHQGHCAGWRRKCRQHGTRCRILGGRLRSASAAPLELDQAIPGALKSRDAVLQSKPDDSTALGMFKNAVEGTGIGELTNGFVKAVRLLKDVGVSDAVPTPKPQLPEDTFKSWAIRPRSPASRSCAGSACAGRRRRRGADQGVASGYRRRRGGTHEGARRHWGAQAGSLKCRRARMVLPRLTSASRASMHRTMSSAPCKKLRMRVRAADQAAQASCRSRTSRLPPRSKTHGIS